ncbi:MULTISPECIES: hypothetical protein [unclassified Leptolyngbya]|uniref:hypothetical protein n=1 Tax=unclassified Leptolyngbya TaxID=2650499 RepID=UPI001684E2C4|nr:MULTISPECIES: hypothetical protein [unclassified Leptolyngbya]MBD1913309.1 hypothetical protein [Leptolyngbya sp. FACHB-8]MBD2155345.1 hypothetical protein [Leptolyngbya sp. FACHB-16]
MTSVIPDSNASDIVASDYVVIGLATCFIREDGEVHPVKILEPIPSAALEALVRGIPTSYEAAWALTVEAVLANGEPRHPEAISETAQFCDEFASRAIAAARTYKARPMAQALIPAGTVRQDFNVSLERKRVLNSERLVKIEDNVKQHAYTHQTL